MKSIIKKRKPKILTRIYKMIENGDMELGIEPFEDFIKSDFRDPFTQEITKTNKIVQKSLADEQGWICCYCNCEIEEKDGVIEMKIEHYKPESIYTGKNWSKEKEIKISPENRETNPLKDLRIEYGNFLCACKGKHCDDDGSGKGDWELTKVLNPAEVAEGDFQRVYEIFYSNQGYIYSKHRFAGILSNEDSSECKCTCEGDNMRNCLNWELGGCFKQGKDAGFLNGRLNLNAESLKNNRQAAWFAAIREILSEVFRITPRIDELSKIDWRGKLKNDGKIEAAKDVAVKLIKRYSSRKKKDQKYNQFCMYVLYRLKKEFEIY